MRCAAREGDAIYMQVQEVNGDEIPHVTACDTDEGWFDQYQLSDGIGVGFYPGFRTEEGSVRYIVRKNPAGRLLVLDGEIAPPVRHRRDFDVLDKRVGRIVASYRGTP